MAMLGARFVGSLPMSLQKDFARRIRPHVDRELAQAAQLDQQGNPLAARVRDRYHAMNVLICMSGKGQGSVQCDECIDMYERQGSGIGTM